MAKLPIVEGIERYIKEENISFCMPGHKNGKGFLKTTEGRKLFNNLISGDITEVDGVDNLHNPEGIIKDAEDELSKYYKSKKSYFLVNGSTSGNLAMVFSSFNEGDKIIVERNCHRSVFNAIIMRKLKPVYLKNKITSNFDAPLSIDKEHFLEVILANKDAKGILLTYPNYYGVCCDLRYIVEIAKENNMKVLLDAAHGAHFGVNNLVPKNPMELGADMVVMSAHKTLPSLTQTAFLHIGEGVPTDKVDFYVSAFMSTSPSYMFMNSMDYARFYLQEYGEQDYRTLYEIVEKYRDKIDELEGFKCLSNELIKKECEMQWSGDYDATRLVINLNKGYSGHKLLDYLRANKIQCEMSSNSSVVCIPTTFNDEEDFEKLYLALKYCDLECITDKYYEAVTCDFPKQYKLPYEVMECEGEEVALSVCNGRIAKGFIVPYPPGIPLIMPGEVISTEVISVLEHCIEIGQTVLGVKNGKVNVCK